MFKWLVNIFKKKTAPPKLKLYEVATNLDNSLTTKLMLHKTRKCKGMGCKERIHAQQVYPWEFCPKCLERLTRK